MTEANSDTELSLVGYERLLEVGFALPCYARMPRANTYYRAVSDIAGDREGKVVRFEQYAPSRVIPLDDKLQRQVSVGDLWCDVILLGKDDVLVGNYIELWSLLASRLGEMSREVPLLLLEACPEGEGLRADLARRAHQSVDDRFGPQRAEAWRDEIYLRSGVLRLLRRHVDPEIRSPQLEMKVGVDRHIQVGVVDVNQIPSVDDDLRSAIGELAEPFFTGAEVSISFSAAASDQQTDGNQAGPGPSWRRALIERTVASLSRGVQRVALILPTVAGPTSILDEVCRQVDELGLFKHLIMVGGRSSTADRVIKRLSEPGKFRSMSVSARHIDLVNIYFDRPKPLYEEHQDPSETLIIFVDGDLNVPLANAMMRGSKDARQLALLPPNLRFKINGRYVHEPSSVTEFLALFSAQESIIFDYDMAINTKLITGTVVVDRSEVLRGGSDIIVAARARDRRNFLICFEDLIEQFRITQQKDASCLILSDIDARDFNQILPKLRDISNKDRIYHRAEGTYSEALSFELGADIIVAKPDQFDYEYLKGVKNVAIMANVIDIGLRIHWFQSKIRKREDDSPRRIFDYSGIAAQTHPASAKIPSFEQFVSSVQNKYNPPKK